MKSLAIKFHDEMKGRKWMHNETHTIMVFDYEIEEYKSKGYIEGRGKIK